MKKEMKFKQEEIQEKNRARMFEQKLDMKSDGERILHVF